MKVFRPLKNVGSQFLNVSRIKLNAIYEKGKTKLQMLWLCERNFRKICLKETPLLYISKESEIGSKGKTSTTNTTFYLKIIRSLLYFFVSF